MIKPLLIFGYGNLSRGDDALGPLVLAYIENTHDLTNIELISDFQLQIEHALDLEQRTLVLFVDASVSSERTITFTVLKPTRDSSYTSHAMSPAAVLDVYVSIKKQLPPPSFLLSIQAEKMALGEGLSAHAEQCLKQACQFAAQLLNKPEVDYWQSQVSDNHA